MIELLLIGAALLILAKRSKADGIGRIKRRIWKEVSEAQTMGIDFTKKYAELDDADLRMLNSLGETFGYKQTKRAIESGKPYSESYFNSLRRAYNSVAGIGKVRDYTDWRVRNANNKTVLIYREYADAIEHIQNEDTPLPDPITTDPVPVPDKEDVPFYETAQQRLLAAAPHMLVWNEDTHDFLKGANRTTAFDYVVWQSMTDAFNTTNYPIAAFPTKARAEQWANDRRRAFSQAQKRDREGKQHHWNIRVSIRVLPVDKVNINAISGIL